TISGTGASGATGALQSISGTNSFSSTVALGAASTVSVDANSLTLSGVVSGAQALTKAGAGTLAYTGNSNTYSGTTTVNAGELDLNKTAGQNAFAGSLVVGDGTGTDTVKLLANNQIPDATAV